MALERCADGQPGPAAYDAAAMLALSVVLAAAIAAPSSAADIVALRLEVEALARTLDEQRSAAQAELAGLRAERAELQRQVRLARVRNRMLLKLEAEDAAADEARQAAIDEWNGPARAAVAAVRRHVEGGLPFARAARLEAVDAIAAELAGAMPDTGRAMQRLWRVLEEEAAMAREVTLARQQVELDDGPRLCDVLRIGMALMYVRAEDGRLGFARDRGDAWEIEIVDDAAGRAVIEALFEAADANTIFGPAVLLVPEVADAR